MSDLIFFIAIIRKSEKNIFGSGKQIKPGYLAYVIVEYTGNNCWGK